MNNLFLRIARIFRKPTVTSGKSATDGMDIQAMPENWNTTSGNRPNEMRRQRRRGISLRIKLPITVIALLAFAFFIATFFSVQIARNALTSTLQEDLIKQATSQADLLDSHLVWTRSMAVDLAASAEVAAFSEESILGTIRQTLSRNDQIFGSTIAYEPYQFDSEKYYWSPYFSRTEQDQLKFTQLGNSEYDYFKWDWYTLPKKENAPVLSPPYFDEGGGNIWMVTWSVPFYDKEGAFMGVATTDISFQQTQDIVRQISVGRDGYAFLIDQQGTLLGIGEHGGAYKIMEDPIRIANNTQETTDWNNMVEAMIKGESGFANVTDPQGRPMFVAYQPIGQDTGWSLGLAFPQVELFQPAVQLQNTLISYSILITVLASVILFFFTRSVTHPIQQLATQASLISQSELRLTNIQSQPIVIKTHDELEDLGIAFNQMVDKLAASFQNIEQRVADRTKALSTSTEVTRRLTSVSSLRQLAVEVVEQVKSAFNYYHAHIYFVDEKSGDLMMTGGTGEAGATMLARGHKVQKGRGLVGRAAETNAPVLVLDVSQAEDWLPNPLLPETRSEVAIPISSGNQVLGVLDVQQNIVNGFGQEDVDLLQSIAGQVAISLKNVRAFEESRSKAEIESMVNLIGQKIQRAASVEETLQTAIRELSTALGASRAKATISLTPQSDTKSVSEN